MRFLILFVVFAAAQSCLAQHVIDIPFKSGSIERLFAVGDTLFLLYEVPAVTPPEGGPYTIKQAALVSDRLNVISYSGDLRNVSDLDISSTRGAVYLYSLAKEGKDIILKTLSYDRDANKLTWMNGKTVIEGEPIATVQEDTFYVLTYDSKEDLLRLYSLDGDKLVFKRIVPYQRKSKYGGSIDIEFVEQRYTNAVGGSNWRRLVHDRGNLYLIEDSNADQCSFITKIPLSTDDVKDLKWVYPEKGVWRATISNGFLYAYKFAKNQLRIEVFNEGLNERISSKLILETAVGNEQLYLRSAKERLVKRTKSIPSSNESILVTPTENGTILRVGSYILGTNMVGPSPGGVAGVVKMALGSAIRQLEEAPSTSIYGYLRELPDHSDMQFIKWDATDKPIQQRIDEYEIQLADETKIKTIRYAATRNGIAALYLLPKKDVVRVVRFE